MGRKLWLFYAPDQVDSIYNGNVDPFSPDLDEYPAFQNATAIAFIQEPYEIVYTPSGWWHCVLNLEAGFALTENFINSINIEKVKADLVSIGAMKAVKKLISLPPLTTNP
jgi:hypothetical protein